MEKALKRKSSKWKYHSYLDLNEDIVKGRIKDWLVKFKIQGKQDNLVQFITQNAFSYTFLLKVYFVFLLSDSRNTDYDTEKVAFFKFENSTPPSLLMEQQVCDDLNDWKLDLVSEDSLVEDDFIDFIDVNSSCNVSNEDLEAEGRQASREMDSVQKLDMDEKHGLMIECDEYTRIKDGFDIELDKVVGEYLQNAQECVRNRVAFKNGCKMERIVYEDGIDEELLGRPWRLQGLYMKIVMEKVGAVLKWPMVEISEEELVQGVLYLMLGIESRIFRKMEDGVFVKVNEKFGLKHMSLPSVENMLKTFLGYGNRMDVLRQFGMDVADMAVLEGFKDGLTRVQVWLEAGFIESLRDIENDLDGHSVTLVYILGKNDGIFKLIDRLSSIVLDIMEKRKTLNRAQWTKFVLEYVHGMLTFESTIHVSVEQESHTMYGVILELLVASLIPYLKNMQIWCSCGALNTIGNDFFIQCGQAFKSVKIKEVDMFQAMLTKGKIARINMDLVPNFLKHECEKLYVIGIISRIMSNCFEDQQLFDFVQQFLDNIHQHFQLPSIPRENSCSKASQEPILNAKSNSSPRKGDTDSFESSGKKYINDVLHGSIQSNDNLLQLTPNTVLVPDIDVRYIKVVPKQPTMSVMTLGNVDKCIDRLYNIANERLLQKVVVDLQLHNHVLFLHKTILMKDDSYMAYFQLHLFEKLNAKENTWISTSYLSNLLQQSIAHADENIAYTSLLNVKLLHHKAEYPAFQIRSMEMMGFEYNLPWPIPMIVGPMFMELLSKVAVFILQIKRTQQYLLETKQQIQLLVRSQVNFKLNTEEHMRWHEKNNQILQLGAMIQFVQQIQQYIFSKHIFMCGFRISSNTTLVQLRELIETHVEGLQSSCFLLEQHSTIHEYILDMFDLCLQYAHEILHGDSNGADLTQAFKHSYTALMDQFSSISQRGAVKEIAALFNYNEYY